MLRDYLEDAISDIRALIEATNEDIADIKKAKHDNVFERSKQKNNLIISFSAKKALLDNELVLLSKANTGKDLSEILSVEDSELLGNMKEELVKLHKLNKKYAKMVVTVGEFYNSMVESMFPSDMNGYEKGNSKPASFLKVRA